MKRVSSPGRGGRHGVQIRRKRCFEFFHAIRPLTTHVQNGKRRRREHCIYKSVSGFSTFLRMGRIIQFDCQNRSQIVVAQNEVDVL